MHCESCLVYFIAKFTREIEDGEHIGLRVYVNYRIEVWGKKNWLFLNVEDVGLTQNTKAFSLAIFIVSGN